MDWPAFIAAMPGNAIDGAEYKTTTVKQSAYPANSPGLEQSKERFVVWCKAHGGASTTIPGIQTPTPARTFFTAVSAWSNQELVLYGNRYTNWTYFCHEAKTQELTAVLLVRAFGGYRDAPYDPNKLPAPVFAFYTPAQASEFADFYNQKEKERALAAQQVSQQRSERQAEQTHKLRTAPKIGDQTADGIIIDLRPPLALIQYNAMQRQLLGKPQSEWVQIQSLIAPR